MSDPGAEVAAILASGVRRLHARGALGIAEGGVVPAGKLDTRADSYADRLEVPGALPLHGPAGLTGGEASVGHGITPETGHES